MPARPIAIIVSLERMGKLLKRPPVEALFDGSDSSTPMYG
jgi:hypothetical protein